MTLNAPMSHDCGMIDVFNTTDTAVHVDGHRVDGFTHAVVEDSDHVRSLERVGILVVHDADSDDKRVVKRIEHAEAAREKAEEAEAAAAAKAEEKAKAEAEKVKAEEAEAAAKAKAEAKAEAKMAAPAAPTHGGLQ